MFWKKKDNIIIVDDCIYIHRNGRKYRQLSFWDNGTRYSTIIKDNVTVPDKGTSITRSELGSLKI